MRKFTLFKNPVTLDILFLLLLIMVAFLIRYVVLFSQSSFGLYSDDVIYMSMARSFLEGDFSKILHPWWSPFFPLVSAFFHVFIEDWGLTGRAVSVVFGSLLVVPIYIITKTYTNRFAAILSGIFIVLFRPLVNSSIQPLSESLLIFFIWMALMMSLKSLAAKNIYIAFSAGIFWGLASLTKSEGALFFISLLFIIFVYLSFTFVKSRIRKVAKLSLVKILVFILLGFLVVYAPYNIALQNKYNGKVTLLTKVSANANQGSPFHYNNLKTSTWAQDIFGFNTFNINSEFNSGYLSLLKQHSEAWIRDTTIRINYTINLIFINYLSKVGVVLFLFSIFWLIPRLKNMPVLTILFLALVFSFLMTMFFAPYTDERYVYSFFPLFPIGISVGLNNMHALLISIKNFNKLKTLFFIVAFLLIFKFGSFYSLFLLKDIKNLNIKPSVVSPYDQWLAKNDPGKRAMMRHEANSFYSRSFVVYPPNAVTLKELLEYARLWKVDYIIAEMGEVPADLTFLVSEPKDYTGIKLLEKKGINLYKIIY